MNARCGFWTMIKYLDLDLRRLIDWLCALLRNPGYCCEDPQGHTPIGGDFAGNKCERLRARPPGFWHPGRPFYAFCTSRAQSPPGSFCAFRPSSSSKSLSAPRRSWQSPAFFPRATRRRFFPRRAGIRPSLLPAFRVLLRPVAASAAGCVHRAGARTGRARSGTVLLVLLPGHADLLSLRRFLRERLATGHSRNYAAFLSSSARTCTARQSLRSFAFQCCSRLCTSCSLTWQNACS